MAKDPAFLFYSDNFQTGTQFFTHEQVGMYIRLLCAQHLHGHLHEKQVLIICGRHDTEIMQKFVQDDAGLYYNLRLENEILKRKNFSESRRKNRQGKAFKGKKHINKKSKRHVIHMGNGNGNGNDNINNKGENEKNAFIPPTCAEVETFFFQNGFTTEAGRNAWNYYNDAQPAWTDSNGKPVRSWKQKMRSVWFREENKISNSKKSIEPAPSGATFGTL